MGNRETDIEKALELARMRKARDKAWYKEIRRWINAKLGDLLQSDD